MAPGWPACSPPAARWWWSWTAPSAPSGATGQSLTRLMPSAPPAKPCRGPNWARLAPADSVRVCRCCWLPAGGTIDASGDAQRQLFSLVIAAPECLRERFRGHKLPAMLRVAAQLRTSPRWDTETATTAAVLRDLARRALALSEEAARHEKAILAIVRSWRPGLLAQPGIGPIVAAVVLCAWSHPGRIRSEAAFAMLAGVAPIPASSGEITTRHRLNRYGDRQLNRAMHTVVLCRLRYDPTTQAYAKRRTAQGKTPREIKRCLKRYVARDLYRLLENPPRIA
jgi:transposase